MSHDTAQASGPAFCRLVVRSLQREFAEGSARLRRLDELEQGEFLEATNRRSSSRMVVFAPLSPLQLVTHLLEVETEGTTPGSLTLTPRTWLLTALQLHGVRPAGPGSIVYSIVPDWYFSARSGGRIPIAKGLDAGDGELDNEQFVAACGRHCCSTITTCGCRPDQRSWRSDDSRLGVGAMTPLTGLSTL